MIERIIYASVRNGGCFLWAVRTKWSREINNSVPPTIEEWLDQFDMFSIYEVLPQILDLLTIGLVIDMWTEKGNDDVKYKKVAREATQEDFDLF